MNRNEIGGFAPEMQVKQYVAEVHGKYASFRVFETGSIKHYLFDAFDPQSGISGGLQFPVLKADLQPDVKRALRRGLTYRVK